MNRNEMFRLKAGDLIVHWGRKIALRVNHGSESDYVGYPHQGYFLMAEGHSEDVIVPLDESEQIDRLDLSIESEDLELLRDAVTFLNQRLYESESKLQVIYQTMDVK